MRARLHHLPMCEECGGPVLGVRSRHEHDRYVKAHGKHPCASGLPASDGCLPCLIAYFTAAGADIMENRLAEL
jgi:hypothetical protein